ncbi:pyridoxamine 5'-phosphate oxidase [Paraphotobacterium marinum]|uniref:Pyridoxamine 5'-phosphate oxidase n=1 Tax=Paraphotobacterium marinum TaxID=1755811 RepID=A0A220VHB2_9GAMM|nr:pyridoxamine 5'-phosphate oxidase [Paraphotobacterium marinum]ASK79709.1 pyridoxamine 5'-phosphate oxidase [Paraphotobacterium marinum]
MSADYESSRREYLQDRLNDGEMPPNPFSLFEVWLKEYVESKAKDPTAMVLATVNKEGQSFQRIVLMKELTNDSIIFYTNLKSNKANQIKECNKVSINFPWQSMDRQVNMQGEATFLDAEKSEKYFLSRPFESQIAAWSSPQSQVIESRGFLDKAFEENFKKFSKENIKKPEFWGGVVVKINYIEFWQGGGKRLHDRFLYQKEGQNWNLNRLAP